MRKDERKYIDDLVKEAETTASHHNMQKLYATTRQMSSRFKATNHQIRDLNGNVLTTTEEQSKR